MTHSDTPSKQSKSERTRSSIVDCYVGLLGEVDFDKVTVSRLCKELGIVRSTFYSYFRDIYEVTQQVEDNLIDAFSEVDSHMRDFDEYDRARATTDWGFPIAPPYAFGLWFDVCEQHRAELKAMLGPHGDAYFEQKLRKHLERHISLMMDQDHMPDDTLRRGFTETMVECHMLLTRNWILHEKTSLNKDRILTILNSMRLGSDVEGYYIGRDGIEEWWH